MQLSSVPWYRWRFSLGGVSLIGLSFYMAWDTLTDPSDLLYLRLMGVAFFLGLGAFFLVLEWRNREARRFRMPVRPEDEHGQ